MSEIESRRSVYMVDTKEKTLKIKLKDKVKEHLKSTHIHGLPHTVRSKYWFMKVFWVISFLAFTAFSMWLVVTAIIDFFEYPVVTEIKEHIERKPKFPAVTICNFISYNKLKFHILSLISFPIEEIYRKN